MAGFRMGRGRGARNAQQQGRYPQQGPPPGAPGPYGSAAYGQGGWQGRQQAGPGWQQGGRPHGEPEYYGEPHGGGHYGGRPDPYANSAGHTQSFSVHDQDPYGQGTTYGGGYAPAPSGPRLHWKDLLSGIVFRPNATFWQMRDHAVWGTALSVTLLYGLLAVFGLDDTRETVLNATMTSALQYALGTGIAVVIMGLILGAVTHTLARQFGGDGMWAPTVGLSMLIMSITDAPRLVLAMFLGATAPLVQVVGWATWVAAGALFTSMVGRSHDLPWPRALGASAIQLLALLALMKLGTL